VKNKRIRANNQVFWLKDYNSLAQLKPNCYDVEAYYMKNGEGNAETVYLYQGDRYIGEAYDVESKRYNECRAEWTDEDRENYLFQNKEQAIFHKMVKDIKAELPKLGVQDAQASGFINEIISDVEIIETPPEQQSKYDYEFNTEDIEAFAKAMC
jgi:energy-coupling factor transporter ATP-binding protein EcfA2